MSLFTTLTSLAASTIIENYKQGISSESRNSKSQSQVSSLPGEFQEPGLVIDAADRIRELSPSPPVPSTRSLPRRQSPSPVMQSSGLPHNSIWTTMAYPIPRGPCLQKSNLISGCSCQRFMVHPLKATTSFDCDGCGHHASYHKMKSHEEEVENAAKYRDTVVNTGRNSQLGRIGNGDDTRLVRLLERGNGLGGDGEEDVDDETLGEEDGEYTESSQTGREKKRRAVVTTSRSTRKVAVTSGQAKTVKRKRAGEEVVID